MVQVKDDWHGGIPSPPIWPQHQLGGIIKRNLGSLGVSQEQESSYHGDFELVLGDPKSVRVSFFWISFLSRVVSFLSRVGHTTKEMAFITPDGNFGAEIAI